MQEGLLLQEDPKARWRNLSLKGPGEEPHGVSQKRRIHSQDSSATKGDVGRTEGWSHVEGSCPSKGVPAALVGLEGSQE